MPSRGYIASTGYRRVWVPAVKREMYEHRLVMEQIVGRPLATDEHVHHINGDRLDNRPENLQLLSASEHKSLTRKRPRPCANCGNVSTRICHGQCHPCSEYLRRNGVCRPQRLADKPRPGYLAQRLHTVLRGRQMRFSEIRAALNSTTSGTAALLDRERKAGRIVRVSRGVYVSQQSLLAEGAA